MSEPNFVEMFAEALDDEMLIAQYRLYSERAAADSADIAADGIREVLAKLMTDRGLPLTDAE